MGAVSGHGPSRDVRETSPRTPTPPVHKVLRIAALCLGVSDAMFLSVSALDAFAPGRPLGQQLVGFAMHLTPSAALAAMVAVAWWFPFLGGSALVLASALPFVLRSNPLEVNLTLGLPVFATGCLYLAAAWLRRRTSRDG